MYKSVAKISLSVNVTGNSEIKYRIVEKKAFDMMEAKMVLKQKLEHKAQIKQNITMVQSLLKQLEIKIIMNM